jgi:hypothetical protein
MRGQNGFCVNKHMKVKMMTLWDSVHFSLEKHIHDLEKTPYSITWGQERVSEENYILASTKKAVAGSSKTMASVYRTTRYHIPRNHNIFNVHGTYIQLHQIFLDLATV